MNLRTMPKEDLELLSYKDMTYYLLQEGTSMKTNDLFKEITELLELPEKVFKTKIGDYYTSLTTDKRFILLENGIWDLRERHTSDKVIIAMDEDEEDEIIDDIDEEEEIDEEFDKVIDDEEAIDDEDDDLKDLVIVDEEELELEQ